jgi:hypothetical protein
MVFDGMVFDGMVFDGMVFDGMVFDGMVFDGMVFDLDHNDEYDDQRSTQKKDNKELIITTKQNKTHYK